MGNRDRTEMLKQVLVRSMEQRHCIRNAKTKSTCVKRLRAPKPDVTKKVVMSTNTSPVISNKPKSDKLKTEMLKHEFPRSKEQQNYAITSKCVKKRRAPKPDVTKDVAITTKTPSVVSDERESEKLETELSSSDLSNHMRVYDRQLARIRQRTLQLRQRDGEIRERLERIRRQARKFSESADECGAISSQEKYHASFSETGCSINGTSFEVGRRDVISDVRVVNKETTGSTRCTSSPRKLTETENSITFMEIYSDDSFSSFNETAVETDNVNLECKTGSDNIDLHQPSDSVQRKSNMAPKRKIFENGKCAIPETVSKSPRVKAFVGERFDCDKSQIDHSLFNITYLTSFSKDLRMVGMTSPKSLGISPKRLKQQKSPNHSQGTSRITRRKSKLSKLKITKCIMQKLRKWR